MQKEYALKNMAVIARQRNVFVGIAIVSLLCLVLVSLKLLQTEDKTILVPGLHEEAWVSNQGVSTSYLEHTTIMYLPLLLDLDTQSIGWKRDRLMQHVSTSSAVHLKQLSEYFARVTEQYKQFSLSTHFALKKLETNPKDLTVRAFGQLISRFGNRGFEQEDVAYGISYEWVAGKLLLKEFVKLDQEEVDANK